MRRRGLGLGRGAAGWLLLSALAGCGGEEQPVPDTTPPAVVQTEPAAGASGVSVTAVVRAWFDEDIDRNRFNSDFFHLRRSDGASLFGNVSYDLGERVASLSMAGPLEAGASYTAVLERGICDLLSNCSAEAYSWTFTVAP